MKVLTVTFLVLFSLTSFGHEYFFGFSELEYNEISQKFECTIISSTHDIELALKQNNIKSGKLVMLSPNSKEFKAVEAYLNTHFKVWTKELVQFKLIGSEVSLSGTTNFYLESEVIDIGTELRITFDLLMNTYQQQQNKVTLKHRNNKYTETFLYTERTQIITLENK
ncbi:MAG: hypothetical protein P8N52_05915 [Crocinitomicaceae bacterium]|nr:hypothetical protein [Crocinitomicaceae bacterium]MDG1777264.1 hypothetical protein [Crocinitomicaceae bacterium]